MSVLGEFSAMGNVAKAYKKSFTLKGTASRSEFWTFQGFIVLSTAVMMVLALAPLWVAFCLISISAALTIQVRRLHDLGRSGFWILVVFVPYVGALGLFLAYCLPGKGAAVSSSS